MTPSKKAVAIPVAWITDTESADLHGWISCKAWSEGEFTTPLVLQSDLAAAIARAEALERERDALRAFAQDVMEDWNEGDLDGGTRQDLAERHGLIAPIERFAPCGEECGCSEFFTEQDWTDGQQCYHVTTLLTGKPESDAAIAAQQAEGEA